MLLFENVSIVVEKEDDIYRAYAFNAVTENNIVLCKCTRQDGAVSGLFSELRKVAIEKLQEGKK